MSKRLLVLAMLALFSMFVMAGCSGDDGKDASVDSVIAKLLEDKAQLEAALEEALESGNLQIIEDLKNQIAELQQKLDEATGGVANATTSDVLTYSDFAVATEQSDVVLTFKVKTIADGKPFEDYTGFNAVYAARNWREGETPTNAAYAYERNRITSGGVLTQTAPGVYEIRFADAANSANANIKDLYNMASGVYPFDSNLMVTFTYGNAGLTTSEDPFRQYYLVIEGKMGEGINRGLVTDQACANCHGTDIFNRGLDSALELIAAQGDPTSSLRRGYHYATGENDVVTSCTTCHAYNGNLAKYAHGIHMSTKTEPVTVKAGYTYAITFPNSMENCAVCHDGSKARTITDDKYFKYSLCTQCHVPTPAVDGDTDADKKAKAWGGWNWTNTAIQQMHVDFPSATEADCTNCHTGGTARKFSEMHAGWDPTSPIAKNLKFTVKSVDVAAGVATIKWSALKNDGTAYDLRVNETNSTASVPAFSTAAKPLGKLVVRVAYGLGADINAGEFDITNEGVSRGRNNTINYIDNTVLSADGTEATTTVTLANNTLETVAMFVVFNRPSINLNGVETFVNAPSMFQPFKIEDGTIVKRRTIVDDAKCTSCHAGAIYHSGGRGTMSLVAGTSGGVETCLICHNTNSTQAVTADPTAEHNYISTDIKFMIHRIHAATENEHLWSRYNDSQQTFGDRTDAAGIYYPQSIKNCEACHVDNSYTNVPKPTFLAHSVAGGDLTTRTDDTVVGAAYATCASCHTGKFDKGLEKHATPFAMGTFGTPASVNKLELTTRDYEACGTCHTRVHVSSK